MGRPVPQSEQYTQRDQLRTGDLVSVVSLLLVFLVWLAATDLARTLSTRWQGSPSGSVTISSPGGPSARSPVDGGQNLAPASLLPD